MTEFEYIIEYLDENDVARDADTQRCQHPGTTSLMVSTIRQGEENLVEIFAGWG